MGFYDAFRIGNLTVDILLDSENNIEAVRNYNEHYRYLQPPPERVEKYGFAVDYRTWENTEYYTDFIKPLGIRHGLVPVIGGLGHTVTIQRGSGPGFSEDEALLLGLISPHIDCVHSCLQKIEGLEKQLYPEIDLECLHCRLTPRQSEIFRLLLLRFSIAEIASYLFIGKRTVEKHIADVYEKLNIRSRYELFLIYAGTEGKDCRAAEEIGRDPRMNLIKIIIKAFINRGLQSIWKYSRQHLLLFCKQREYVVRCAYVAVQLSCREP
jgi:DNA-binding CsgD family transcriptional regulator